MKPVNVLQPNQQQKQGRIIFLLMILFFTVPIVVVLAMYRFDWVPSGKSNGELLSPARKLTQLAQYHTQNGTPLDTRLADKWNMVYVAESCQATCLERLHLMRQIHVSLYKEIPRMQRVLITQHADLDKLKQDYPDMLVIQSTDKAIVDLMQQFDIHNEEAKTANRIYLVDPLQHLVMSYPNAIKGEAIRKDVTHLMKYSWAG